MCLLVAESIFDLGRNDVLDYTSVGATVWTVVLGAGFAVLLYGLLQVEGRFAVPNWLVLMGGASYALYLSHVPVLSIVQLSQSTMLMLIVPVIVALGLHLAFEKPVTRRLRHRLLPPREAPTPC